MLKNVFTILLTTILLWCSLGKTGLLISFKANESYIAKVLCENKAKPEMKCNGKCQLKKQMAAQQEQENNTPISFEKIIDTFWITDFNNETICFYESEISLFPIVPSFLFYQYLKGVFHPPAQ